MLESNIYIQGVGIFSRLLKNIPRKQNDWLMVEKIVFGEIHVVETSRHGLVGKAFLMI
jgi:hypothetical protein